MPYHYPNPAAIPTDTLISVYQRTKGLSPDDAYNRLLEADYEVYCYLWRNMCTRFSDYLIAYDSDFIRSIADDIRTLASGGKTTNG